MKPGSFSLNLIADAPTSVIRAIDYFDHIVITRNKLDPVAAYSDADVLAAAIYTGVITARPTPFAITGSDLSFWLGTPNGLGDLLDTAVTRTAGTLTQWIGDLLPAALTAGTITNTTTLTSTYQWVSRREAIDALCRSVSAEYLVRPNGTVDAGPAASLFRTAPTVVVTARAEGPDGAFRGLEGTSLNAAGDVEQYTTKAIVVAAGQGPAVPVASSSGSTSFKDFRNNTLVMERFVNAPTEPSANAAAVGASIIGRFNSVRRQLSLSSRTHTVGRFVTPGDYVWAWDKTYGLVDTANQIVHRGELISPMLLRVYALTWPIEQGVGVYARRSGATPAYTDLTDWVDWETGDVRWEVGAGARSADDTDTTEGSTAYLGANPDVAARATDAANGWTAPTLGNGWTNFGGGNQAAQYRIVGDQVQIRGVIASGTLGATAFTLPVGFRPPAALQIATATNSAFGLLTITAAGAVVVQSSSNVWASIHCAFSTTT